MLTFQITAPFNNMQTLKFKAQLTNAFFATVNQMFGSSSQLPTILTELCSTMWFDYCALMALVGSWEEMLSTWLMVAKNAFVGWALNCRVCMLLKGAVIYKPFLLGFFVCRDVSVSIPEQTKQIIYILYDDIGKLS